MTKDEIKHQLMEWKLKFQEAFEILEQPDCDLDLVSKKYADLKLLFKTRYEQLNKTSRNSKDITPEQAFLWPAITDVYLHCTARVGSKNKQELSSSLYDGKDYLSYWINEIG